MINIGSGQEKSILGFCKFLMKQFKVNLKIKFDKKKPKGTPRKILDTSLARSYGWRSKFDLIRGFELTYNDFLKKQKTKN